MSPTRRSGPATGRSDTNTFNPVASVTDLLTARALAGPPCPGRTLWAVTTPTCAHCGGMHQHRVGEVARLLAGRVVRVCPTSGQRYILRPVQRRKEARR